MRVITYVVQTSDDECWSSHETAESAQHLVDAARRLYHGKWKFKIVKVIQQNSKIQMEDLCPAIQ